MGLKEKAFWMLVKVMEKVIPAAIVSEMLIILKVEPDRPHAADLDTPK